MLFAPAVWGVDGSSDGFLFFDSACACSWFIAGNFTNVDFSGFKLWSINKHASLR